MVTRTHGTHTHTLSQTHTTSHIVSFLTQSRTHSLSLPFRIQLRTHIVPQKRSSPSHTHWISQVYTVSRWKLSVPVFSETHCLWLSTVSGEFTHMHTVLRTCCLLSHTLENSQTHTHSFSHTNRSSTHQVPQTRSLLSHKKLSHWTDLTHSLSQFAHAASRTH